MTTRLGAVHGQGPKKCGVRIDAPYVTIVLFEPLCLRYLFCASDAFFMPQMPFYASDASEAFSGDASQ